MDFELWWLLAFPVFFVLGWIAARIDIKYLLNASRTLPNSYFRGLNFLLNEEPDKAIDAFIEAAKIDSETAELHFALGNLFRRRGEADRAIRVHQNLVEREDLRNEDRLNALTELGHDYLKAGLLDRAEEIFQRLRNTSKKDEALGFLLEIYQQEKEWQKAIEIALQLAARVGGHLMHKETAHFYCEQAIIEINHSHGAHGEQARQFLEQAMVINRKCVRAFILLGDLELGLGQLEAAIKQWKKIESQNPLYLSLVAVRLMDAYSKLNCSAQGLQLLRGYLEQYPSLDLLDTVFQWELEINGSECVYRLVQGEIKRNPTLLGLDKLLEAKLIVSPPEQRYDLEIIKNIIHAHTRRVARYRCDVCGFKARQFYWRCPACGGWETYPPKRTEEFDLAPPEGSGAKNLIPWVPL